MGMFDCLRCEYPLPDEAPATGWQTRDTPNQFLQEYVITADGRLVDPNGETLSDFHGDVESPVLARAPVSRRGVERGIAEPGEVLP